ncbi:ATP-dependent metallopeptidase [Chloropicon primus]|uniref:ATP-dependent metallopeptidase n=1 Tax=Chloropicon primus TaxID=1764295 RepID=A0A5B8MF29_9CHLO|nr:ATP-dependent metallopeptidase [Chloropicon primus]UPQ97095.1 ATP-dependent metallopeptidase [Chloropicon primus]|eukprot:QDZ17880.1 ATP-dependent metallopeptidase [Chloropicon primus]
MTAASSAGVWVRATAHGRRTFPARPALPAARGPGARRLGTESGRSARRPRALRCKPRRASTEPSPSTSTPTPTEGGEEDGKSSEVDPQKPNGNGNGLWDRIRWYLAYIFLSPARIVRLLINVSILSFLFKVVPISGVVDMETIVVNVPYSDFMRRVERDQVKSLEVDGNFHTYRIKDEGAELRRMAANYGGKQKVLSLEKIKRINYQTVRPANMQTPYETLLKNDVRFGAPDKRFNKVLTVMSHALAIGIVLAVISRFTGRMGQGGGMRKPRKMIIRQNIKFKDVAGVDEAKEELQEVVEYLRDPGKFTKLGARPPAGLLLVGSPGTGKTLLAKAVAGEANVPFFSIAASEFVELYVGMGASRVRELFTKARKESPAIVFIDEIDAVAKGRDSRLRSMGNDEREQTLNQLLTELDGFDTSKDSAVVICMAATNRPDVLDAALLRPGRFDRRITVERPDRIGREQILKVHVNRQKLEMSEDIDLGSIASETIGFTGADLANIVNEAALLAGRKCKDRVEHSDFAEAIERNIAGIEKKRSFLKGREKYIVAVHEAGHAVVGTALNHLMPNLASKVEKLSIIPRSSGALGFTYIPPTDDRALMFETELRGRLAMLMGGRAAEDVEHGVVTTGAMDDIRRATDIAYKIVAEWGLSRSIGPLSVATLATGGQDDGGYAWREQGGALSEQVDREVKELLDGALLVAKDALRENSKMFLDLASTLEEQEKLQGKPLSDKLRRVKISTKLRRFVEKGEIPASAAPE